MGQKVNSNGLRYGVYKNWESRWVAADEAQMAKWLVEDDKVRKLLLSKYKDATISNCEIERQKDAITLFIHASQPVVLLEENGNVKKTLIHDVNLIVGKKTKVTINVVAIPNPGVSARLIAREIADSIEKRVSFRVAQKLGLKKAMKAGALGVKTHVSGRLGGVEMARAEGYSEGVIPLSTLRADLDYALEEAHTTYGIIGVKVWINRGTIFKRGEVSKVVMEAPSQKAYSKAEGSKE